MNTLIVILLLCSYVTLAQKPETKPDVTRPASPETLTLPLATQQEIAESQRQVNEATLALEVAKARLDAAQQRVITAVVKAMAEAGCSPSKCTARQDKDGAVYFERLLPPASAAAKSIEPRKQH